jgi:paraquat-inducible protein A
MHSLPLIACRECDLLQRETLAPVGATARCLRCEAFLYRRSRSGLQGTLAFTLAAIVLFLLANAFPLLSIELQGSSNATTLWDALQALLDQGRSLVAMVVFLTAMVVPALQLGTLTYMLLPLYFGRVPPFLGAALRLHQTLRPWSMLDVFVLGVLVAVARLSTVASVDWGIALWSFGGFIVLLAAAMSTFNVRELWARAAALR